MHSESQHLPEPESQHLPELTSAWDGSYDRTILAVPERLRIPVHRTKRKQDAGDLKLFVKLSVKHIGS